MIRTYLLNRKDLAQVRYSEDIFSQVRKDKMKDIKFDEDRELSACVELLLIYAVKTLDPEADLPLNIREEKSGKLELETPVKGLKEVHFNLSHAKDWAVCSISDKPVGVDIEYAKANEVARPERILHPEEYRTYAYITNPTEKKRYFYECWVSKESYLKNLGVGLIVRPSNFMVNEDILITEEGAKLKKRYVHVYRSEEIKNSDWKFGSSYRLAVCSMKKDEDSRAMIISPEDINALLPAVS